MTARALWAVAAGPGWPLVSAPGDTVLIPSGRSLVALDAKSGHPMHRDVGT